MPLIVWIMINYFDGLPRELEEAAQVDGCTLQGAFFRVVLPLSGPGILTASTLAFLFSCVLLRELINSFGHSAASDIVGEGLLIIGWVAMWRPIQIFLYEWWPIVRRRRTYFGLAHTQVRVIQGS